MNDLARGKSQMRMEINELCRGPPRNPPKQKHMAILAAKRRNQGLSAVWLPRNLVLQANCETIRQSMIESAGPVLIELSSV